MKLREYQIQLSDRGADILRRFKIVYYALEVRTGKTLIAMQTAVLNDFGNVIFLTKKKAIASIEEDYQRLNPPFALTVINYESLHKIEQSNYDLLICDEHHTNGAYPKPNKTTREIKKRFSRLPMIFLSGTPHPESYSQVYHQFWISRNTPFHEATFYKWAKNYVKVKDRHLGYAVVKDYSDADKDKVMRMIDPYVLTFTQAEAGFETKVKEHVMKVRAETKTYNLVNKLKRDKFVTAKDGREIIADTAVKLMQKLHQMCSGTVKFEDGTAVVFDLSKARFIREQFTGKRIGIFYKFKAEYAALKRVFTDEITNELQAFNGGVPNIALQIVSGREGISLSNADYLVYYNIDFSALSYWQSRDRMTTKDREINEVYWVFIEGGIEEQIYRTVLEKRDYTVNVFKKDIRNNQLKLYELSRKVDQTL